MHGALRHCMAWQQQCMAALAVRARSGDGFICQSRRPHSDTECGQAALQAGAMLCADAAGCWVQVKEVTEYRRQVYALVRKVLEAAPDPAESNVGWDDPAWAMFMGFEHERIHIETSTVLIRELPLECVKEPRWVRRRRRSCMRAPLWQQPALPVLQLP